MDFTSLSKSLTGWAIQIIGFQIKGHAGILIFCAFDGILNPANLIVRFIHVQQDGLEVK